MQLLDKEDNTEEYIRNKITWISFMLCCLVFYIHSNNVDTYGITQDKSATERLVFWIEYYGVIITQIAVPGFFLISGFLFFRTFKIEKLGEKIRKRVHTIIIPYVIWCTFYYLYQVGYTNIPVVKNYINSSGSVGLGIKDWIMCLGPNSYYTLWFLKNLIVLIALTPIAYYLLKNYKGLPTGMIVLVVLWLVEYERVAPIRVVSGISIYMIGAYIGINHNSFVYKRSRLLSWLSFIYVLAHALTGFRYLRMTGIVVMLFAVWFLLDFWPNGVRVYPWMRYTFFYYVAHDFVLQIVKKLIYVAGGCNPVMAGVNYVFSPIVTMCFLVMGAQELSRIAPCVWEIITGRRDG